MEEHRDKKLKTDIGIVGNCEQKQMDISVLPEEILMKVFSYLHFKDWAKLQCTSKRWQQLLSCDQLWGNDYFHWKIPQIKIPGIRRVEVTEGNKHMSLAVFGASRVIQKAMMKAQLKNISGYFHLAKVSYFYTKNQLANIVTFIQGITFLNYFQILRYTREYGLQNVPEHYRSVPSIILSSLKKHPKSFIYAPAELRDDRAFNLLGIKKNANILRYAENRFKEDKSVMLEAITNHGALLKVAAKKFSNDRDIVLAAVTNVGIMLQYASKELRNDREVVLTAVVKDSGALQYASRELQSDREVVLAAVEPWYCRQRLLHYVSVDLRADKKVVLAAVRQDGYNLGYASEELRNDREVVLAAVVKDSGALQYASEELRNDQDVVLASLVTHIYGWQTPFQYVSADLQKNIGFLIKAKNTNPEILKYLSQEIIAKVERTERLKELYQESRGPRLKTAT